MNEVLIAAAVLVVLAVAYAVVKMPRGSGGAPGETVADEPLSHDTPAEWEDRRHAGGAEDRPGGPAAEATDPDAMGGSQKPPRTP